MYTSKCNVVIFKTLVLLEYCYTSEFSTHLWTIMRKQLSIGLAIVQLGEQREHFRKSSRLLGRGYTTILYNMDHGRVCRYLSLYVFRQILYHGLCGVLYTVVDVAYFIPRPTRDVHIINRVNSSCYVVCNILCLSSCPDWPFLS
jgi:hypothetical protein